MPDPPSLVIVGAGGLGRGVAALVEAVNASGRTWELLGFADDDEGLQNASVMGYPILGDVEWLSEQSDLRFVVAIADAPSRRGIENALRPTPLSPTTLIHPSVSLHRTTDVGTGTIIRKGVATAVDIRIGPHAILNMGCTLGHDATLAPLSTLHPGVHISGRAHVGKGATLGTGAVVLPGTTVGPNATVGAGAVVTEDLPPDCTVVGVPARPVS